MGFYFNLFLLLAVFCFVQCEMFVSSKPGGWRYSGYRKLSPRPVTRPVAKDISAVNSQAAPLHAGRVQFNPGQNQTALGQSSRRDARFLSLFTLVQFENLACTAQSGDNGTCLTNGECVSRGGIPSGFCANGFGMCCLFITSCGGMTRENGTYFVNSGYPKMYENTGSCQLTIMKAHPDVCQFRLDFDQFTLMGPETVNNVCNNDQFIVSGGSTVPPICGINNGNHMYIDVGLGATNPLTITVVTSGPSFPRMWKIKITQIFCQSMFRAEEGCLQYHTGISGTLKSFNYDPVAGLQLSNQDYSICIRMEKNFCAIQYSTCDDPQAINNRSRAFTLSGNSNQAVQSMVGSGNQPNSCNSDWLGIPCATNVGRPQGGVAFGCVDRICGGTLNAEISLLPSAVMSSVKPFRLSYHTDNVEAPNDYSNRGFCLNYVQQPCTNVVL